MFYHDRSRKDIKYCTGGFHGSDNLFTNMQVSGRGSISVIQVKKNKRDLLEIPSKRNVLYFIHFL